MGVRRDAQRGQDGPRAMPDGSLRIGRVRAINALERYFLIEIAGKRIARKIIRGLIWDRLGIWLAYATTAATFCSAILLWGAEIAERLGRLLHALGLQ